MKKQHIPAGEKKRQIKINPNVLLTRQWDLPIKLYYAQMRAIREEGIWDKGVIDIGSSIETDESEMRPLNKIIQESHEESIQSGDYTAYASSYGSLDLRAAVVDFCARLGCSDIDMHSQVMITGGTIDAVSRVIRSLDVGAIIIPSWAPFFVRSHAMLAGLEIIQVDLHLDDGSLDLQDLDRKLREKDLRSGEILMYIAHPASPVGKVMRDLFIEEELIPFLKRKRIWALADTTVYSTKFDGSRMRPLLSYPGFSEVGVESITLSKEFGLPGLRIGGLVGHEGLINAVRMLAGTEVTILPAAEQRIAAKALKEVDPHPVERRIAKELQTETLPRLRMLGWPFICPQAGVDMMIEVPPHYKKSGLGDPSLLASFSILRRYGVGLCPGSAFGPEGKNYLRLGLKHKIGKVPHALDILHSSGFRWSDDEPSNGDVRYLQEKLKALDLTRL